MRRFRFRLEPVLKHRKTLEEQALRGLGAAQRAFQLEVLKKNRLRDDLARSLGRREQIGLEPTGSVAFQLENDFIAGTKQRLIKADQAIFRASKNVEKALRAYLKTKRDTRAIELLRQKALEEFRKEQGKREQREQDDLNLMRQEGRRKGAFSLG
jgi:flagellar FliJ protein